MDVNSITGRDRCSPPFFFNMNMTPQEYEIRLEERKQIVKDKGLEHIVDQHLLNICNFKGYALPLTKSGMDIIYNNLVWWVSYEDPNKEGLIPCLREKGVPQFWRYYPHLNVMLDEYKNEVQKITAV